MRASLHLLVLLIALFAAFGQPHHHGPDERPVCALCTCAHDLDDAAPARPELAPGREVAALPSVVIAEHAAVALLDAPKQGPPAV